MLLFGPFWIRQRWRRSNTCLMPPTIAQHGGFCRVILHTSVGSFNRHSRSEMRCVTLSRVPDNELWEPWLMEVLSGFVIDGTRQVCEPLRFVAVRV